jgi:hypothetical protein
MGYAHATSWSFGAVLVLQNFSHALKAALRFSHMSPRL